MVFLAGKTTTIRLTEKVEEENRGEFTDPGLPEKWWREEDRKEILQLVIEAERNAHASVVSIC